MFPVLQDEPPQTTTVAGVTYRRTGYCCRCGDCCKTGDPIHGTMAPVCPLYQEVDGIGGCTDRSASNSYYWNGCRLWPSEPDHVADKPRCTYRFEVVRGG